MVILMHLHHQSHRQQRLHVSFLRSSGTIYQVCCCSKLVTIKNPQANALIECIHGPMDKMIQKKQFSGKTRNKKLTMCYKHLHDPYDPQCTQQRIWIGLDWIGLFVNVYVHHFQFNFTH